MRSIHYFRIEYIISFYACRTALMRRKSNSEFKVIVDGASSPDEGEVRYQYI